MKKKLFHLSIFSLSFLSLLCSSFLSSQHVYADSTWTKTIVDSSGVVGQYSSIALGNDGFARISYNDGVNEDLKFVRCTNADCTEKNITTIDSEGNVGQYTSIALGTDGFARISYQDVTNFDLKFVRCTNADCTEKNITTVDSDEGVVGQYTSLALGTDGFARISYFDATNSDLKFVQCTNADCTEKNITTIDSEGNVGQYTSIALGTDGFARISYTGSEGFGDADLNFVRCTNADCTEKNITTVDSEGKVGSTPSIALGNDGFARISYLDTTNFDLKFVRCTNADCTEKNITTIDSEGNVGQYTSIALGTDGFARISYQDITNNYIKFARCANADCTNKNIEIIDAEADLTLDTSIAVGSDGLARVSYFFGDLDVGKAYLKLAIEKAPQPTPGQDTTPANSSHSTPSAPKCTDSKPTGTPDLFQIDVNNTQAILYFAPASNSNKYFIAYGNEDRTNMYGVEFETGASEGVLSYTVNHLHPDSNYSFKVRGGKGCMPGDWGNTMNVTTSNSRTSGTTFYKDFVSRVLSVFPKEITDTGSGGSKTVSQAECHNYKVVSGDNLWNLALKYFGKGTLYSKLMQNNNLDSTLLSTGQDLKIGC